MAARAGRRDGALLLAGPALIVIVLFMLLPMGIAAVYVHEPEPLWRCRASVHGQFLPPLRLRPRPRRQPRLRHDLPADLHALPGAGRAHHRAVPRDGPAARLVHGDAPAADARDPGAARHHPVLDQPPDPHLLLGSAAARRAIEPHSFCHSTADTTVYFSAMPAAANETVVTCKWLVHKDAVEGLDYDVERLTELWNVTNLQDRDFVENNQRGVNSLGYVPGLYCEEDESYVRRFVDWYCEKARAFIGARTGADSRPIALP